VRTRERGAHVEVCVEVPSEHVHFWSRCLAESVCVCVREREREEGEGGAIELSVCVCVCV